MLQAVRGYYELGMNDDAWEELRSVEKNFPDQIARGSSGLGFDGHKVF